MKLIIDFILVLGLISSLLIVYKIIKAKTKLLSHTILIIIFVFILIIILNFYADLHDIDLLYTLTLFFEDASRILLGSLIYIYIKSLFVKKEKLYKILIIHSLPYILYTLIFSLPIMIINFGSTIDFKHLNILKGTQNLGLLKSLCLFIYLIISVQLFNTYKYNYKLDYSTFTKNNFLWVKRMLVGAIIIICIDLLTFLLDYIHPYDFDTGYITVIALIIIIFYLGNYGVNQPFVFLSDIEKKSRLDIKTKQIKGDEATDLKHKIENILFYEKLYLNQELTLKNLANKAEISDKKLSYFLNQHLKTSFYDLVNSYRLNEFKKKINLPEYKKYSLVGIAYTCGFNSKSSFYRVFKKETGISPAQFKKNNGNKS